MLLTVLVIGHHSEIMLSSAQDFFIHIGPFTSVFADHMGPLFGGPNQGEAEMLSRICVHACSLS